MFNIFEQPWFGLIVAGVLFIIQRILRAINPVKWTNTYLLVPLAVVGMAFGADYFFETDREKINGLIDTIKKSVIEEDTQTVSSILSPDYKDDFHRSREIAIGHLKKLFNLTPVKWVKILEKDIDIVNGNCDVKNKIFILFEDNSPITSASVSFTVSFTKSNAGKWLITSSQLHQLNNQPVDWGQLP